LPERGFDILSYSNAALFFLSSSFYFISFSLLMYSSKGRAHLLFSPSETSSIHSFGSNLKIFRLSSRSKINEDLALIFLKFVVIWMRVLEISIRSSKSFSCIFNVYKSDNIASFSELFYYAWSLACSKRKLWNTARACCLFFSK
jgi:hypothetical protein